MSLLAETENQQARAKVGCYGRQGSGKTSLVSLLAIATVQKFCAKECDSVAFYDSESGSDFLLPIFKAEGVRILRYKGRSFRDLMTVAREAENDKRCGAFICDSITHPWNDLMESLKAKLGIKKLAFHHFGQVKNDWRAWPDFYLNSRLHLFVAGRLGFEWLMQEDEETHKLEPVRGGSKMKTEVDFGHEPNLLCEVEAFKEDPDDRKCVYTHRAHVLKDRSWRLNGKFFDFRDQPTYKKGYAQEVLKPFLPHFEALNIGGEQFAYDPARDSQDYFSPEGRSDYYERQQERKVALEEIEGMMTALWPGQDAKAKKMKAAVVFWLFATRSWSKVETLPTAELRLAQAILDRYVNGVAPGDYAESEVLAKLDEIKRSLAEQPAPASEPAPADAQDIDTSGPWDQVPPTA